MAASANTVKLIVVFLLGGVTFIPLVLLLLFFHAVIFLPRGTGHDHDNQQRLADLLSDVGEDASIISKISHGSTDADVAAGYYAVCREYVPGGINGKPPERKTPAGETIAAESTSVYQSIYRSMFDRKTQSTSLEGGKAVKRARNVFYVVLRHGHLMLFDTAEQLEVRHVISLTLYRVSVRGEDDPIPDGELWIKRNAIQLTRVNVGLEASHPLFFFSDNCSEKEDFYHSLLASQRKLGGTTISRELKFETDHMIKLIRLLHASEENIQTRWLNALIGRIFLALYKTAKLEDLIKTKIRKKISRVSKPAFITSLALQDVSLGDSAPIVVNLRLREMTVDGGLTLEADVKYSGSFSVVIAAVARIDLGKNFKAREVDLVLAAVLKKLDGHLLILIKPPPSNRIWISFETMPKLQLVLEPIVSTRQITYGIILRAIESRVREVVGETMVYPNWDDIPFTSTEEDAVRGGIWEDGQAKDNAAAAFVPSNTTIDDDEASASSVQPSAAISMPDLTSVTSEMDQLPHGENVIAQLQSRDATPPIKKSSNSSVTLPGPQTATATATRVLVPDGNTARMRRRDVGSQNGPEGMARKMSVQSSESSTSGSLSSTRNLSRDDVDTDVDVETCESPAQLANNGAASLTPMQGATGSLSYTDNTVAPQSVDDKRSISTAERRAMINHSLTAATAAAKRWVGAIQQRSSPQADSTSTKPQLQEPIGRGSPLPPLGQPLPGPKSTSTNWITLGRNAGQALHARTASLDAAFGLGYGRDSLSAVPRRRPVNPAMAMEDGGTPMTPPDSASGTKMLRTHGDDDD